MRWLRNLFGRPPQPTITPDSPVTWQDGDLAECVTDGAWHRANDGTRLPGPQLGEVRMVTGVRMGRTDPAPRQYLLFKRWGAMGFAASEFRKIQPRAEDLERADSAFMAQLRRLDAPVTVEAT